jgi:hypothetical protein
MEHHQINLRPNWYSWASYVKQYEMIKQSIKSGDVEVNTSVKDEVLSLELNGDKQLRIFTILFFLTLILDPWILAFQLCWMMTKIVGCRMLVKRLGYATMNEQTIFMDSANIITSVIGNLTCFSLFHALIMLVLDFYLYYLITGKFTKVKKPDNLSN